MSQSPARRRRRLCLRRGHSRLKVIDGRLFCTVCESYVDPTQELT